MNIGYSYGLNEDLDETNLDETMGWGSNTANPIGFNLDSDKTDTGLQFNIQYGYESGDSDLLKDSDDWNNLIIDFQRYVNTDYNLLSTSEPDHENKSSTCSSMGH